MHRLLYISFFLSCSTSLLYQKLTPKNDTQQFELNDTDWQNISSSQFAFSFKNPDTTITHQMQLLSDANGLPLLYYSDILTPVCIDGLCKPVYVELYWDLLGQYVGYGDYPDKVLTKYDHEYFEEQDYLKLHQLLLDKTSVIGRRRLQQLYDQNTVRTDTITFKGVEVDGISGATRKEIKESIVEGGLYSCYTLWHLVYGPAVELMRENIDRIYTPAVEDYFLNSNYDGYQYYAIRKMDADKFNDHIDHIVSFITTGKPLSRSYALKKMPKHLFKDPIVIDQLYKQFSNFDFNAKTLLLENLHHANSSAAVFIADSIGSLSKNQLVTFLEAIQQLDAVDAVKDNLIMYAQNGNSNYSFLVEDLIELNE